LHRLSLGENLQRQCRVQEAWALYQGAAGLAPHNSRVLAHARLTNPETDAVHAEPPRPVESEGRQAARPPISGGGGGGGGSESGGGSPPSLDEMEVRDPSAAGWEAAALRVLRSHGAVVVRRLLNASVCAALLREIENWPEGGEGTSWSTRQPHKRRHQALPARTGASGRAAALLLQLLRPLLTRGEARREART
jgi:hypothetical protein